MTIDAPTTLDELAIALEIEDAKVINDKTKELFAVAKRVRVLRNAARALHKWHELRCGVQGESTDVTLSVEENDDGTWTHYWRGHVGKEYKVVGTPCKDNGAKAIAKIEKALEGTDLYYYVQGDPRGAPLFISDTPLTDANYNYAFAVDKY